MKYCPSCGEHKDTSLFYKNKARKDGLADECKDCRAAYRSANKEAINLQQKRARAEDIERFRATANRWAHRNKPYRAAAAAQHRFKKKSATPPWADKEHIESIYAMCAWMNMTMFGQKYHVDHLIPLVNKNVCGFHTQDNLRIIRAEENMKKSNRFNPDQCYEQSTNPIPIPSTLE